LSNHHAPAKLAKVKWISLCQTDELQPDKGKYVEIDGFQLAVFFHNGQYFALDNTCPHAGGPIWEGEVENDCVTCPWHAWTFRLQSGELRDAPGVTITHYKTRLYERPNHPTLLQAELPIY
jgi:nitrite reductase (NADH) small subunit